MSGPWPEASCTGSVSLIALNGTWSTTTLISGFLASKRLSRSSRTSPSLPSEYQAKRNVVWACAPMVASTLAARATATIQVLLTVVFLNIAFPSQGYYRLLTRCLSGIHFQAFGKRLPNLSTGGWQGIEAVNAQKPAG